MVLWFHNKYERNVYMSRGPQIDKNNLVHAILSQTDTFTPDDLAKRINYSRSAIYTMIKNDLLPSGKVILDRKDGHRMYYAVSGKMGRSEGVSPVALAKNIMSLSVVERFSCINDLTEMVVEGISPSIMITGIAGIGKTYLVKNLLKGLGKVEGDDYHFVSGHSSPMGLYRFLYEHRDATIVFDDCDSVFENDTSINILKSALDSYDVRKVCWMSCKMPEDLENSFDF